MANNSPEDFVKAMDGKSRTQAPVPSAAGGPIRGLGAVVLALGLASFHAYTWTPFRTAQLGVGDVEYVFIHVFTAPMIIAFGVLMVSGGLMAADRHEHQHGSARVMTIYRFVLVGVLALGFGLAIGLRWYLATRGY